MFIPEYNYYIKALTLDIELSIRALVINILLISIEVMNKIQSFPLKELIKL